jgi:signal recognition particle subunit SRP14
MSKPLSNADFLSSLTTLLSTPHQKSHGSVYLTQKTLPSSNNSASDTSSSSPEKILIRATNGIHNPQNPSSTSKSKIAKSLTGKDKKIKLSTIVDVGDLEGFYAKYADVCKRGMEGLRKRDKSKGKKKKAAKKGAGGTGKAG